MPQDAGDELGGDAELGVRAAARGFQPAEDGGVGDAARGVGLRVEEDLGVDEAIAVRACEVGVGEGLEVGGRDKRGHADEVVVQEVGEGGEVAVAPGEGAGGGEGGVFGGGGQGNGVLGCQLEEQGRLERAFDV